MSEVPRSLPGRLAGIDFGTVRIGIALSDPGRSFASPWETYHRRTKESDQEYFRELVRTEKIVGFVVGLPVHMSGDESQKSREARVFGEWLGEVTGIPVSFHDERYSTADAQRLLAEAGSKRKRAKQTKDKLAAQLILTSYLESGHSITQGPLDM